MKSIKLKCKKCGDVEISTPFCEWDEEGFILPVALAPTIQSLGKFYNNYVGETYEYNTGNKISSSFEKQLLELKHTNPDEDGEDWQEHTLELTECWRELI